MGADFLFMRTEGDERNGVAGVSAFVHGFDVAVVGGHDQSDAGGFN